MMFKEVPEEKASKKPKGMKEQCLIKAGQRENELGF